MTAKLKSSAKKAKKITKPGTLDFVKELATLRAAEEFSTFLLHGNTFDLFFDSKGSLRNIFKIIEHEFIPSLFTEHYGKEEFITETQSHIKEPQLVIFSEPKGFTYIPEKLKKERSFFENIFKKDTPSGADNPLAGITDRMDDPVWPRNPIRALNNIETLMLHTSVQFPIIFILEFSELTLAANDWTGNHQTNIIVSLLIKLANLERLTNSKLKHTIILLSMDDLNSIHPAIRRGESNIKQICVDLPDKENRKYFLTHNSEIDWEKGSLDTSSRDSAGLSVKEIRRVVKGQKDPKEFDRILVEHRKDFISRASGGILKIDKPKYGREAVGGLDYVFDIIDNEILPFLKSQSTVSPSGILFTGPPGTGKSITAEAISKDCGLPFITMQIDQIFHCYVGSSERNIDTTLKLIEAVSPCIVWMDELDQMGLVRGAYQGDSGVSARVFRRLLEFIGDDSHHGKILFIGASNEPQLIDSALRRTGRFDIKIPFLPGPASMRKQIFEALLNKHGHIIKEGNIKESLDLDILAKETKKLLGSDIEFLLKDAIRTCIAKDKDLTTKVVLEILPFIKPSVEKEKRDTYVENALKDCNVIHYLPDALKELALKAAK